MLYNKFKRGDLVQVKRILVCYNEYDEPEYENNYGGEGYKDGYKLTDIGYITRDQSCLEPDELRINFTARNRWGDLRRNYVVHYTEVEVIGKRI